MNDQSNGQKLFLTRLRRHRITVLISRVLILTVFLFLWEFFHNRKMENRMYMPPVGNYNTGRNALLQEEKF